MKLFFGGLVLAVMTSVASAGFVIEDPPTAGNSWTQHIVAFGPFDYISFEFLEGAGGPFEPPGLSGFVDHFAVFPPPIVPMWAVALPNPRPTNNAQTTPSASHIDPPSANSGASDHAVDANDHSMNKTISTCAVGMGGS